MDLMSVGSTVNERGIVLGLEKVPKMVLKSDWLDTLMGWKREIHSDLLSQLKESVMAILLGTLMVYY